MAIDAIIVYDMKINEYFVHFSVYFQLVTPSEKVEIVSTLYFNTACAKGRSTFRRKDFLGFSASLAVPPKTTPA